MAQPDGVPQEAWIRLGAVQEIVRTPLCEEFTRLQRRVDEMRGLMRGKICIGTFSSVATHVLPPVIARFRADHPDIDYELLMGDYSEIEQWVAEGRCDLGFIPREPRGAGMASRPLVRDELMAVVPTGSLLAAAEVVSLADLANEQFILLERGTDDEITPLFRRAGLAVRSKLSTWDDYAIMAMVEDGLGVSILPALILRRCQFDVAVRPLEGHPHRQINAIYRTADVSLAAARFLEYL